MNYMGGKTKCSERIASIINKYISQNKIDVFYDVFTGGGNVADKINCKIVIASDLSPTLIALHQQAQKDFSLIPKKGSKEYWDNAYKEYKRLKENNWENPQMPLYEIGAIEWYASYTKGGFPRGYTKPVGNRNYFAEGRQAHMKQARSKKYKNIIFKCSDYQQIDIPENALIYLDPPTEKTKPYGINPKFDYITFIRWIREKSKTNPIFLSNYNAPNDFKIVWTEVSKKNIKDYDFCEKLYFIDNRQNGK